MTLASEQIWVLVLVGTWPEGGESTSVLVYRHVEDALQAVVGMMSDEDWDLLEQEQGWEREEAEDEILTARTLTEIDRAMGVVNDMSREWDNPTQLHLIRTRVVG